VGSQVRRRRVSAPYVAAAVTAGFFIAYAVVQLATLGPSVGYDFLPYYQAGQAIASGQDPYGPFLHVCQGKYFCEAGFLYSPAFAYMFRPFVLLSPVWAERTWILVSHACFLAALWLALATVRRELAPPARAWLIAASLGFLPLYDSIAYAQVNGFILLVVTFIAWLMIAKQRGRVAAVLTSGLAFLRLTPLGLYPAFLVSGPHRQRIRMAVLLAASSIAVFGLFWLATPITAEFFQRVLPQLGHGSSFLDNQSLPALAIRLRDLAQRGEAAVVGWTVAERSAGMGPGLETAMIAVAGALVLVTSLLNWDALSRRERALGLASFLALLPIVSSYTWSHHLLTELLVYILLAPSLLGNPRVRTLAIAAYPFLWQVFTTRTTVLLGLYPPHSWRLPLFMLVTSSNLIGMLLLWAACLLAAREARRVPISTGSSSAATAVAAA
jgi:hypothetical protein